MPARARCTPQGGPARGGRREQRAALNRRQADDATSAHQICRAARQEAGGVAPLNFTAVAPVIGPVTCAWSLM